MPSLAATDCHLVGCIMHVWQPGETPSSQERPLEICRLDDRSDDRDQGIGHPCIKICSQTTESKASKQND